MPKLSQIEDDIRQMKSEITEIKQMVGDLTDGVGELREYFEAVAKPRVQRINKELASFAKEENG